MTHEEEKRLRLILMAEGCPWEDLEALVEDFRHEPDNLQGLLRDSAPLTESSQ